MTLAAKVNSIGLGGDDVLFSFDGPDILSGGPGNDRMYPGTGADTAFGGDGNDTISGGNELGGGDTIRGERGDDYLYGSGEADLIDGGDGADNLYSGDGADTVLGGAGNDTFSAHGTGGDIWDGGDGNDVFAAQLGSDAIFGGRGNDSVFGSGDDLVTGGKDADLFVFVTANSGDAVITDFKMGEDTLRIDNGGTPFSIGLADVNGGLLIQYLDSSIFLEGLTSKKFGLDEYCGGLRPVEGAAGKPRLHARRRRWFPRSDRSSSWTRKPAAARARQTMTFCVVPSLPAASASWSIRLVRTFRLSCATGSAGIGASTRVGGSVGATATAAARAAAGSRRGPPPGASGAPPSFVPGCAASACGGPPMGLKPFDDIYRATSLPQ
jgi:hypothetical protein